VSDEDLHIEAPGGACAVVLLGLFGLIGWFAWLAWGQS
jgi:hypothetical protein